MDAGLGVGLGVGLADCATLVTAGGAAAMRGVDDAALCESIGIDPTGVGLASLLAAQAIETPANDKMTGTSLYLLSTITHFSSSVDEFFGGDSGGR
ncbi:MAG: hypothetical protein ACREMS_14005 [Gemmatimonadaceae bacterium]